jgi:hypothetical protein
MCPGAPDAAALIERLRPEGVERASFVDLSDMVGGAVVPSSSEVFWCCR